MNQYAIRISPEARKRLLTMPKARFDKVHAAIDSLQTMPNRGSVYDPVYEAAQLPFTCRVVYAGQQGVYYTVHHDERLVYVRFIEDQWRNPRNRFNV